MFENHRSTTIAALLLSLSTCSLTAGSELPGVFRIPDSLQSPNEVAGKVDKIPIWIAADALDPTDFPKDPLLARPSQQPTDDYLLVADRAYPNCFEAEAVEELIVAPQDRSTFEKRVKSSHQVLTAKIVGSRTGFFGGFPATLFAVEILEVLHGAASPSIRYFDWPVGHLDLADGRCIKKSDYRFRISPTVGDEVLLMTAQPNKEQFLYLGHGSDLAILHPNGEVEFQYPPDTGTGHRIRPKRFRQEVLDQIRSLLLTEESKMEHLP